MKATLRALITVTLATAALIGCGSDKEGNHNDNYGYYNNGYNGYGYQQNINPDTSIFSGGLSLENGGAWKEALKGLGVCNDQIISTCYLIDNAAPRITAVIKDKNFRSNGTSQGSLTIGSAQVQGQPFLVQWYGVNGGASGPAGFDTQILPPREYKNRLLRVYVTGKASDPYVNTEFYFGNSRVGTGRLYKANN